jgi:hypothetical protein
MLDLGLVSSFPGQTELETIPVEADAARAIKLGFAVSAANAVAAAREQEVSEVQKASAGNPPTTIREGKLPEVEETDEKSIGRDDSECPPPGVLRIGIDWLTGVFPCTDRERIEATAELLEEYFGDRSPGPWGGWQFRDGVTFALDKRCDMYILKVPGVPLRTISFADQISLVEIILCMGGHLTRIDIALDDTRRKINLPAVAEAARSGEVCGFKKYQNHEQGNVGEGSAGLARGVTFGLPGRWGGGKQVVWYDKGLESETCTIPGQWVRMETRFFKENAQKVAEKLVGVTVTEGLGILGGLLAGAIDFRSGESAHLDRRQRAEWWDRLVDVLGQEIIVRPARREETSATDSLRWKFKAVAPVMKAFEAELGPDRYWAMMRDMVKHASGGANGLKRQASVKLLGVEGCLAELEILKGNLAELDADVTYNRVLLDQTPGWGVYLPHAAARLFIK